MKEIFANVDLSLELIRKTLMNPIKLAYYDKNKQLINSTDFYETLFEVNSGFITTAVLLDDAFNWFESKFNISGEVTKQAPYEGVDKTYWWYMILDKDGKDLSDWNKRFEDILTKSEQNIEGNYVNNELFINYLYEDNFAFESRYKAKEHCLYEMLKLI